MSRAYRQVSPQRAILQFSQLNFYYKFTSYRQYFRLQFCTLSSNQSRWPILPFPPALLRLASTILSSLPSHPLYFQQHPPFQFPLESTKSLRGSRRTQPKAGKSCYPSGEQWNLIYSFSWESANLEWLDRTSNLQKLGVPKLTTFLPPRVRSSWYSQRKLLILNLSSSQYILMATVFPDLFYSSQSIRKHWLPANRQMYPCEPLYDSLETRFQPPALSSAKQSELYGPLAYLLE